MIVEGQESVPNWTGAARNKPRARSAIANGRKLIMADGRSMWAKRFIETCSEMCADLGGFETLSASELAMVKRCSTLIVELESQETRLARGEGKIDLVAFAQISNGLRRMLETLHSQALKRVARDCTPDLASIIREHAGSTE
jgi:hypothetical protein